MKVFYLFSYNLDLPGVNTKILDKISSFNNVGLQVKGLVLYNDKNLNLDFLPEEQFEKHYFSPERVKSRILNISVFSPLNTFLNNMKAVKELYETVLSKHPGSLIITRYGNSDYSSLWLIRKVKGNIIYESNTNEIEQQKIKFKGIFKSPLWVTYDYYNELYFGPKVLRKTKGIVCVTNEIALYQKKRVGEGGKTKVVTISNGINVGKYELAPTLGPELQEINLIMLLGVDSPWNGLDKITEAMSKQSSKIKLYVVGNVKHISENEDIIYTGQLSHGQITKLIVDKKICAGVATLALERKGITEAAPLKVREYLSRGLPVIYNYKDTDIDEVDGFNEKYCVKLKDNCDFIDLIFIENKLRKIVAINNYNASIKEFALEKVDVCRKSEKYKSLIDTIQLN